MKRSWIAIGLAAALSGCLTVGPDYEEAAIVQADYSDVLQASLEEAGAGALTPEALAAWWESLDDPLLTELIGRAVEGNRGLQAARARVRAARWRLGMRRADLFPGADAGGAYQRSRTSEGLIPPGPVTPDPHSDFFRAGFDASWELDIFGGKRRGVEAARADLDAEHEALRAIWVSLSGAVAQSYIGLRTYQARLRVAETNLESQRQTYALLESLYAAGLSDELAVQQVRYVMESTRASIPTLRSGLESTMNSLAVLTGEVPGTLHARLREAAPIPVASLKTVTGIPANALRQRPDIRRAERQVAAQTARIGEATAQLYPKFFLAGSIGLESLETSDFLDASSRAWHLGPAIAWPIFHAGAIRKNIKAQTAVREHYLALYEDAVLNGVKEVREALVDYAREQERQAALKEAVEAAEAALHVAQDKYRHGLNDFNNVLDAQRAVLQFQEQLAISEGLVSINLVRIYKALGGGWAAMEAS